MSCSEGGRGGRGDTGENKTRGQTATIKRNTPCAHGPHMRSFFRCHSRRALAYLPRNEELHPGVEQVVVEGLLDEDRVFLRLPDEHDAVCTTTRGAQYARSRGVEESDYHKNTTRACNFTYNTTAQRNSMLYAIRSSTHAYTHINNNETIEGFNVLRRRLQLMNNVYTNARHDYTCSQLVTHSTAKDTS